MRITIHLIRHAESESNVSHEYAGEDCLSGSGRLQAQSLASRFRDARIEGLYQSGILRSNLTAEEIQKATGLQPATKECFRERKVIFREGPSYEYKESFESLKERLVEARTFMEGISEQRVAIVSHAIFMKSLAAYLMFGESLTEEILARFNDTLVIENTGVCALMFNKEKKKWRVVFWNDVAHLKA